MNLSQLTSAHLRQALKLLEQRDSLRARLAALEGQLATLSPDAATGRRGKKGASARAAGGEVGKKPRGRTRRTRRTRGRRGDMKAGILGALQSAGAAGIGIKELAGKLGAKNANVHQWFATTGKKVAGLEKVGPGKYRLAARSNSSAAN